ncbi:glycosyltransferase [Elusimicrobiota bacterium]
MSSKNTKRGLTIGFINPQGHVRWNKLQIASHPDTGGQIVYIIELAKTLEKTGCKVDIFTRYFKDPEWPGYDKEIEEYSKNLRIIRIKCGPDDKFVRKEDLWPIMNDFALGIEDFYKNSGYTPDVFASHYADAGIAASILKVNMKIPFTHTGHSLGGKKMDNLRISRSNFTTINNCYKFHLRIFAERISLRNSGAIVVSTQEEIDKQYGHKVYRDAVKNSDKFNIIPPGIDPALFYPYNRKEKNTKIYNKAVKKLQNELEKHIRKKRLDLPCIFSAARFDAKKNPAGLLRAYAESEDLQENTNLLIIAGKVEDPLNPVNRSKFNENEKIIVKEIVDIISEFELEGKVCVSPCFDYAAEMPYIYRYAGRNDWIFINPALHEPFGLTVVEAMASGLPVVATKYGGVTDILQNEHYGLLIEPTDWHSIRAGLKKMLMVRFWKKYSRLGIDRVKQKYTWQSAAEGYKELFERIIKAKLKVKDDYNIPGFFLNPHNIDDSEILEKFKKLYYIG